MELRKVVRISLAAALVGAGLLVGAAQAQSGGETPLPAATETAGMQRQVKLSPEEQVKSGQEILARMDSVRKDVQTQLEKAREQRDVVKSLCLSDKLTQIDVAKKSAGERFTALQAAVTRQDTDLANHEYTMLVVLKDRTAQLQAEAAQCIGVEAGFVGESKVTVEVSPNLPHEDPTEYPPNNPIITQPPACVSCVQ